MVYLTLKRDCQYWSTDVDDDEEDTLIKHTNEVCGDMQSCVPSHLLVPVR